jgi:hypothetical protein
MRSAREAILADLRPVRRLGRPGERALVACGAAGVVLAVVPAWLGVRSDLRQMSGWLVWGAYLLQVVYASLLIVAALRDAVPGRQRPRESTVLFAGGIAIVLTITAVTWLGHPTSLREGTWGTSWRTCFTTPVILGLPPLLLTLYLIGRAYPLRPALVGAVAGLGAGLLVDASWRTYCPVTDPVHILTSHLAAVLVLSMAGAAIAFAQARVTRRG